MKRVDIGDTKSFKIIPENKSVEGRLFGKWVSHDLKEGIKPIYRFIIDAASDKLMLQSVIGDEIGIDEEGNIFPVIYGTSYCDKDDEFNEKIGIDVCSAKMELKNHRKLVKFYKRLHKVLMETMMIVDDWCIKHQEKADAIDRDLVEYYGRGQI